MIRNMIFGKHRLSKIPNMVRVHFEGGEKDSRVINYEKALLLQQFQETSECRKPGTRGEDAVFEQLAGMGLLSKFADGTYTLTAVAQRARYTPVNENF